MTSIEQGSGTPPLLDMAKLEADVVAAIPGRAPLRTIRAQSNRSDPMPDYVEHRDGATEIGKLSAEAVVREYEAAAKDIEDLGVELVGHVKQCEAMSREALTVIEELKETAGRYREEAKRVFLQIENCSLVTAEVRRTCVEMRKKIAGSAKAATGAKAK